MYFVLASVFVLALVLVIRSRKKSGGGVGVSAIGSRGRSGADKK